MLGEGWEVVEGGGVTLARFDADLASSSEIPAG